MIVEGLPPGPHNIRIQLENANRQLLDKGAVKFTVPPRVTGEAHGEGAPKPVRNEPSAKIIIGSPLPEPPSRGVSFIPDRTENLQIVPVFGPLPSPFLPASDISM